MAACLGEFSRDVASCIQVIVVTSSDIRSTIWCPYQACKICIWKASLPGRRPLPWISRSRTVRSATCFWYGRLQYPTRIPSGAHVLEKQRARITRALHPNSHKLRRANGHSWDRLIHFFHGRTHAAACVCALIRGPPCNLRNVNWLFCRLIVRRSLKSLGHAGLSSMPGNKGPRYGRFTKT